MNNLVFDTSSTNGLKTTYELVGYYMEDSYFNLWNFNTVTIFLWWDAFMAKESY